MIYACTSTEPRPLRHGATYFVLIKGSGSDVGEEEFAAGIGYRACSASRLTDMLLILPWKGRWQRAALTEG